MSMVYIGIDLGGTNIATGLVDEKGALLRKRSIPTRAPRPAREIVQDISQVIDELLAESGLDRSDLGGVGMGVPSPVDPKTSTLLHAYNLGLQNVDFPALLEEVFPGVRLNIDNDADCAVYGEYICGSAAGYEQVFMFTLGTGVGSGVILDGRLFRGGTGYGIEPGHTIIVKDGQLCSCGKFGCLDAYASVYGVRYATKTVLEGRMDLPAWFVDQAGSDPSRVDPRTVFGAAEDREPCALAIVDLYTTYLAIGVCNALVSYRPEILLIGGGIGDAGEILLEGLRMKVDQELPMSDGIPKVPIEACRLGNDAGIIGAALLSRDLKGQAACSKED